MARHRHAVNVRVDGLAAVLGPLLGDARIVAAVLVDVDSGMVLDAWSPAGGLAAAPDLEMIGAQHAEVVRCALALLQGWQPHGDPGPGAEACEIVLGVDGGVRHLVRTVPDPHGDRLALAVVVDGPQRVLDRVRKRLRSVAVDALTAGPTVTRRPVLGAWSFAMPAPDVPAAPELSAPPGSDPGPAAGPPPAARQPAMARLDVGGSALPAPRESDRPVVVPSPPVDVVPAPPAASAPRVPRPERPGSGSHLRPVPGPAAPEPGRDRGAPRGDGGGGSDDDRTVRRPSPPAALPAPPRPLRP